MTASRASRRSTRSSRSTRARSAGPRARTRPPTPACSGTSGSSSPASPRRASAATSPVASASTSKGGRCENCKGDGILKIEMQFLADVYVPCEVCKGRRYNREALEIHFKGRSIADVLEMTIEEARRGLLGRPVGRLQAPGAARGRARLRPPRPAGDDPLGRRGPAGEARHGAQPAGDRPDPLHARRADDRAPLRRRGEAPPGPPPARRPGQHGPRHRAQPRRHQDGRLDRRPGAGRRIPGRPDRRRGHARGGRREPRLGDRRVPRPRPPWRAARPAQRRHVRRRGGPGKGQRPGEGPREAVPLPMAATRKRAAARG